MWSHRSCLFRNRVLSIAPRLLLGAEILCTLGGFFFLSPLPEIKSSPATSFAHALEQFTPRLLAQTWNMWSIPVVIQAGGVALTHSPILRPLLTAQGLFYVSACLS